MSSTKVRTFDALAGLFDVVISCEVMEHNPFWVATLTNMIRLLKPGGLLVMSCATIGRKEHGTARSLPGASPLM
jgi:2-polyprenyl-3-methyl-5-hydroxy-6-metoxy-1,4-benzoquinol methylase